MKNFRIYGKPPFNIVLVHGGPGAPGEMRPVAEELSKSFGIIEPLQTQDSIYGQIKELRLVTEENASTPVYLIGWSWGAWLSYIFTARYQDLVKKLILVSSGPFEASYAQKIMEKRLERLSDKERKRAEEIIELLKNDKADNETFNEFGSLMDKADTYNLIPHGNDSDLQGSNFQSEIYKRVWPEAEELRKSGKLLELGKSITCPVVAIHGDYDPHPAEGVRIPLFNNLKNFKFYLLSHCGHHPWFEKEAKEEFYEILKEQVL